MSWRQLQSIYEDAAATYASEQDAPPVACPTHGDPLESGPRGELHCPLGDYIWDGVTADG